MEQIINLKVVMQLGLNAERSQEHKNKEAQTVLTYPRCLEVGLIVTLSKYYQQKLQNSTV